MVKKLIVFILSLALAGPWQAAAAEVVRVHIRSAASGVPAIPKSAIGVKLQAPGSLQTLPSLRSTLPVVPATPVPVKNAAMTVVTSRIRSTTGSASAIGWVLFIIRQVGASPRMSRATRSAAPSIMRW